MGEEQGADGCEADEQVVGHERDGEVHEHQYGHGPRRLPLMEEVEVGQPEDEGTRMARRRKSHRGRS